MLTIMCTFSEFFVARFKFSRPLKPQDVILGLYYFVGQIQQIPTASRVHLGNFFFQKIVHCIKKVFCLSFGSLSASEVGQALMFSLKEELHACPTIVNYEVLRPGSNSALPVSKTISKEAILRCLCSLMYAHTILSRQAMS